MEKKCGQSEENREMTDINETAISYNSLFERKAEFIHIIKKMSLQEFDHLEAVYYADCYAGNIISETPETIQAQARRAVEDVEAGRIIDHEELKKRFKK